MTTIVRSSPKFTGKEEIVLLPILEGQSRLEGLAKKLDVLSRAAISAAIKKRHFTGRFGESLLLSQHMPKAPDHILLLGLGKRSALDSEKMAQAAGAASRSLRDRHFKACHVIADESGPVAELLAAFLKGFLLGQYRFRLTAKKERNGRLAKVVLLTNASKQVASAMRGARVVVEHTEKVRDLVNYPADTMTPKRMAQEAKALGSTYGFHCRVMGLRDIQRLNMGAVLSVARGSREEPRFIVMHHNKAKAGLPRVCLVGKGVTFDSGGISIRPWNDMNEMKGDMAGGGVVMSVVAAAAREKLPVEIMGLVPCV
ncbi:MAG: hypothetical protein OEN01_14475, partial [Candidatus Krumholzibacteria bacterium]|nr:hypothetical protein [Candidatus Krumholzibacteria bacterium]